MQFSTEKQGRLYWCWPFMMHTGCIPSKWEPLAFGFFQVLWKSAIEFGPRISGLGGGDWNHASIWNNSTFMKLDHFFKDIWQFEFQSSDPIQVTDELPYPASFLFDLGKFCLSQTRFFGCCFFFKTLLELTTRGRTAFMDKRFLFSNMIARTIFVAWLSFIFYRCRNQK